MTQNVNKNQTIEANRERDRQEIIICVGKIRKYKQQIQELEKLRKEEMKHRKRLLKHFFDN